MSSEYLAEERAHILAAALPRVPFDGWSAHALQAACKEAGYTPDVAWRAFPDGGIDLLEFFIAETDRRMEEKLGAIDLTKLKVRDRIAFAVRARLEPNTDQREAIRRALAAFALPRYAGRGLRALYRTVDAIWYAIGDTSTDFNFYSKRALLAGVYTSTLLYWLDDHSEGQCESWKFLERRIGDVMRIEGVKGRGRKMMETLPNPLRLFRRMAAGQGRKAW